jgi:hypothetical protein
MTTSSPRTSPPEQPHRNHGLFSDHYLNVTLPGRQEWSELADEPGAVMRAVADVFGSYAPSSNEAQTEQDLVRPVLKILGHDFEVQPALETPSGPKRPDYVFYRDTVSVNANKDRALNDELLRDKSFAVGDAKYWERPLDMSAKKGGDAFTNKNPSFQIAFYMQLAGTEWGVLTNGRLWRLYNKDSAHKLDRYYEVDLHALANDGYVGDFLYFYAFFHRSAFDDQPLSVRSILKESEDYARSVGDSLKGQVYEALRHVAQGFLDYPQNALEPAPETLREIYDNSLIVLYRMRDTP